MSDLIPNTNELPPCLRSRLECKDILGAYGVPVTTLRAGLIINAKGNSYPILKKLVSNARFYIVNMKFIFIDC